MVQPMLQRDRTDEQFVQRVVSLCGSDELDHLLDAGRDQINPTVIKLLKDRVAYLVRVDPSQATKLAEATRAAAAVLTDPASEALAQHACALAMHVSGRYAEALDLYDRAQAIYTRLGQEVEAGRIGRAKVDVLMYLGRYEEALAVADRACRVFQRHQQSLLLAQTQENVGNIYHRLGQYHEALKLYDRAREIYEDHQYQFGLGSVSFNAALQYTCLNEFECALTLYRQAQQVYQSLDMPLLVNETEYNIAWLYSQRGKLQESLQLFAKVKARSHELGDTTQEAFCDLDLAEVYLQLNAYQDAIEAAQSAVEKFRTLGMSCEIAKARMYLGIAHTHLKDVVRAERDLQEARRGFITEGNEVFTALTNIYLSDVLIQQCDWHRALQLCTEARQIFTQHGLSAKAASAELELARLKLLLGEAAEAQQLCQSAVAAIGEMEAPWLKYRCFHLLGNTMEQTGEVAQAYRCYTQAVEDLESLRSTIRVDEFRCTFLKDKLRVYEDTMELCLRAGGEEKIEEAFSYAEAAKSRALVDWLAAGQCVRNNGNQSSMGTARRALQAVREELDWYYNRLNYYETRGSQSPPGVIVQLREAAHHCEQQLAKLVRQMHIEDAEYTSLQSVARLDVAQVRQCLGEDDILVEYYIVDGQVKVFVLNQERIRVFTDVTSVETISPLLRQLRFCFDKFTLSQGFVRAHQQNVQTFTDWCLHQLYGELVEPIAPWLEGKNILFVPHGVLHYVPFHALYDGREYLIDSHEVSCCPSASVLKLSTDKAHTRRAGGRVLILGVPDEATPFIHEEVAAVKSLWPDAHVFLGAEASLDRLQHQAEEYRFLHLASHAVFRRDNPMFSALKLGDSWLSFYDLFHLNLKAELVTLGACETGMNQVFPGDELFGLMRGFLYAGVPSLIVSLWVVHDRSTAEFMRHLYDGLRQGLAKRAALRRAQLWMKQVYQHPYYWAPFILMGAPG